MTTTCAAEADPGDSDHVVLQGTAHAQWAPRVVAGADAALIAGYRDGDEAAFEQLFDRYARRLGGMCWGYLHDRALVDDVVQETFSRLAGNAGRIQGTMNVSAWLHRVALNLCLDEVRRRSIRQSDVAIDGGDGLPTVERIADGARWTSPHLAFETTRARTLVREAISRLPLRQRRVLILRELQGMGYQEMADHLGIPLGAVHGLLHRAREGFALHYMELDGLEAPLNACARVTYLRENFGRAGLRADRRRSVTRHLVACDHCTEVA